MAVILGRMNIWERMRMAGRVLTRGADADMPDGIKPPARLGDCDPLSSQPCFVACKCCKPPSPVCPSMKSGEA